MSNSSRTARMRRGALAFALAAVVGGGFAVPMASPAFAAETEVPTEPLISTGTEWKYLDDNTDPAAGTDNLDSWAAPEFDDAAWAQAPGGFGVKNGQLDVVGSGNNAYTPATKLEHYIDGEAYPAIPTYFFRTTFTLDAGVTEAVESAAGTIHYDDGVRIFVNGEQVAGFVDQRFDPALGTNLQYSGDNGGSPVTSTFSVSPEVLQDGENTIAVALYQDRERSSDAYFDISSFTLTPKAAENEDGVVVAAPTRVILTPTEAPATSQAFTWQAGHQSHTIGQVEIGVTGEDTRTVDGYEVPASISDPTSRHYSAIVEDLEPATSYTYRVGLPGSWSEWYTFTTEDPSATDFQFVYYGDAQIGLDSTWPKVVAQAEEKATESIGSVHAGDLIDTASNDTQWQNWFKGMEKSATSTNVFAAPGNHEYTGDKLMTAWKAHFEYPANQPGLESIGEMAQLAQGDTDVARQYAAYFEHWADFAEETVYFADYQNVRFITLNATRDTTFLAPNNLPTCSGSECPSNKVAALWTEYQAEWLDFVLKNSPSKWSVVTFHQPVYSTSSGRDEPVLREYWVPVFQENNVDLVLMGHDHTYGRGYNNDNLTDTVGLTNGPVYAVSNSGAKHYNLASEASNVWTNNGATQVLRSEKITTYQVIDVSGDQLVYRSYVAETANNPRNYKLDATATGDRPVYQVAEVPAVGDLYDEVTVTKYADGQKYVTEPGIEIPEGPTVSVSAAEVMQGEDLTFSGAGFVEGTELSLELHSDPVVLDTVIVGAEGTFSQNVTIPADTSTNEEHSIVAVLPNGAQISTPITVLAAASGGSEDSDSDNAANGGENAAQGADNGADGGESGADSANATSTGGTGAGTGKLSDTGAETLMPMLVGAGLLLAAGVALIARRRMAADARTNTES